MQFIDLQAQYQSLKARIDNRIQTVLEHGKYILGPEVTELEAQLSRYVGVKHTITCANGTDALQLALMTFDVKAGDAVFVPTFTFFASAEVIALAGATPIFVDVELDTFNLSPQSLEAAINAVKQESQLNLKAVISVDLFGLPANYEAIDRIAKQYDLLVIEDAAQGFGGAINSKKAGSFGDIATTSFFPAKPLGCYGDGGAIFTDNDEYSEKLKSLRVHGKGRDKYDNVRIGLNSRLDTIQAAILLEKLAVFDDELAARNRVANNYHSALSDKFFVPTIPQTFGSSWAQYTLQVEHQPELQQLLKRYDIPSAVYYQTCMHQQSVFQGNKLYTSLQNAEKLAATVISLPMHPYLDKQEQTKIIDVLLNN
ncbi:aminotransferase DegT [Saccharobesus litoralis]|uniref:Aminotransferase DegT n=1 Tax=Saccharobesus litoralis TaxID=2172099 RepID=A0A2S0VU81_9ALTE|nr:DegT/DnrJ/EryC1/StrS aminotransferase family protein [Saccharobesus litoralis]AWB67765.1 aminotransferase DegT [Saccharobesus litoralis]